MSQLQPNANMKMSLSNGNYEAARKFPFLNTPSGNLKIVPNQVVFESKKVSVLVADPKHTKVNVKTEAGNTEGNQTAPEQEREKGGGLPENEVWHCHSGQNVVLHIFGGIIILLQEEYDDIELQFQGPFFKLPAAKNNIEDGLFNPDVFSSRISPTNKCKYVPETDFCLEMLGSDSGPIDWSKIIMPSKSALTSLIMHRFINCVKPDCSVVIGDDKFNCHLIVLQCYSSYFDSSETRSFELSKTEVSPKAFHLIYQWMIGPEADNYRLLSKDNILEVFMAAQSLGIKELEEQCWAFIDCDELFSEESAFSMYMKARRLGNNAIMELMVPRIMKFFLTLVSSKNFLHLTQEEMCILLKSNYIAVHCELEVFMSAVRWLMHDWENHKRHLVDIMRCIRFGLISPWQLVDIRRNPENPEFIEVTSNADVQQMVEDGLEYAIVKYWYGNKTEEYYHWCSMLCLQAPSPRNWIGEEKTYTTYQEFLSELEVYRRQHLGQQYVMIPRHVIPSDPPPTPPSMTEFLARRDECVFKPPENANLGKGDFNHYKDEPCALDSVKELPHESEANERSYEVYFVTDTHKVNETVKQGSVPVSKLTQIMATKTLNTRNYLAEGSLFFNNREAVLIFGGTDPNETFEKRGNVGKDIYRYQPEANSWELVSELPEPRHHHRVALLKGYIYLVGGADPRKDSLKSGSNVVNSVWSFDPVTKNWCSENGLLTPRKNFGLIVSNGKLYAIGGQDRNEVVLSSVERFDPATGVWEEMAPMIEGRMGLAAAKFRDLIWVAGGMTGNRKRKVTHSVECYDTRRNIWVACSNLRFPLCFGQLFTMHNTLYLIGGAGRKCERDNSTVSVGTIDVWNEEAKEWCMRTELAIPRHNHSVAYFASQILIIGGVTTVYMRALKNIECYCCDRGTWIRGMAELPVNVSGHDSVTLPPANLM